MFLRDLDKYYSELLRLPDFNRVDSSLNGVQVGDDTLDIRKIAFAVDACQDAIDAAVEWNADLLFVHHGFFWGRHLAVTGSHYRRIRSLIQNGTALYAAHLPLDLHPEVGNNIGIARTLGLREIEPFGLYNGIDIGYQGIFPEPKSLEEVFNMLSLKREECMGVYPFGKPENRRVSIISGGGIREVAEAVARGIDLHITGDASHSQYHFCKEEQINVISGGHYHTETWGVKQMAERTRQDLGIECRFIDIPTGM